MVQSALIAPLMPCIPGSPRLAARRSWPSTRPATDTFDLARRLSSAAMWQPVWATGQSMTAELRLTLTSHTDRVAAVAVGRVGDREVIVSGGEDGTVQVWDAVTGQPVGPPLTCRTGRVVTVTVGRAGDRELIDLRRRGRDGTGVGRGDRAASRAAADWSHPAGWLPWRWAGPGTATLSSPAASTGTVRVWDPATGQPVGQQLTGHNGPVGAVAVGRAGDRNVVVSGGSRWDGAGVGAATGAAAGPAADRPLQQCALGDGRPDPETATWSSQAGAAGTVRVWDAVSGQPVGHPLTGHSNSVLSVTVGRSETATWSSPAEPDQTVRVWNTATGPPVGSPPTGHTGQVRAVGSRAGRWPGRHRLGRRRRGGAGVGRVHGAAGRLAADRPSQQCALGGGRPGRVPGGDRLRRGRLEGAGVGRVHGAAGRPRR